VHSPSHCSVHNRNHLYVSIVFIIALFHKAKVIIPSATALVKGCCKGKQEQCQDVYNFFENIFWFKIHMFLGIDDIKAKG